MDHDYFVKPKVVLVDRDGVLNQDLATGVRSVSELVVFEQAARAVALLTRSGFKVAVVTNQAAVGRGQLTSMTLDAIHTELRRVVARAGGELAAIYVCPHHPDEACECRKPRPGLVIQAASELGFEPRETWLVGDAARDVDAARAAGCLAALVRTGKTLKGVLPAVPVYDDLWAFSEGLVTSASS